MVKTLFGLADHFKKQREALEEFGVILLLCYSFKTEILKTRSALSQSVSLLVFPRQRWNFIVGNQLFGVHSAEVGSWEWRMKKLQLTIKLNDLQWTFLGTTRKQQLSCNQYISEKYWFRREHKSNENTQKTLHYFSVRNWPLHALMDIMGTQGKT